MRAFLPALLLLAFVPAGLPADVRDAQRQAGRESNLTDRFALRLSVDAARSVNVRALPTRSNASRQLLTRLGVANVDQLARSLGVVGFEATFRGETRPPEGSMVTDFTAFFIAHLPAGADVEEAVTRFRQLPTVASASAIPVAPLDAVPNDSLWMDAYHLYQPSRCDIHAPEAWDLTRGDTSIVVAVLDTGVIPYHPDIGGTAPDSRGQLWTNWAEQTGEAGVDDDGNGFVDDRLGWDFVNLPSAAWVVEGEDWRDQDNDPNDFAGHGTGVAGLVGAWSNNAIGVVGTAWNVRLMPLRVGYLTYAGGQVDMMSMAQAVRYATLMNVSIINISSATIALEELDEAVKDAIRAGIVVVVSAGNNGSPNHLGQMDEVITVAATDRYDGVAWWSNRGPEVDLAAPGENLFTTMKGPRAGPDSLGQRQSGYASDATGTSFSAPLVSGAAALVQAYRRTHGRRPFTSNQMRLILQESADDISALNPGIVGYGTGRLNLRRALIQSLQLSAQLESRDGPALVVRQNPTSAPVAFYWRAEPLESPTTEIWILDLTGRRVAAFKPRGRSPGLVSWDGRDRDGRQVPSGLYFATLSRGEQPILARFTLLRR